MNLWQGFFFIFITSILGYQPVSNNRYAITKTVSTLVDRWLSSSNPISYLDDVSLHPHTSGPCYSQIYILSKIWSKQLSYHIFTLCPLLLDSSDYSGRFTLSRLRGSPLSVRSSHMAGVAGFEPANAGVKVPCLTTWLHPIKRGSYRTRYLSTVEGNLPSSVSLTRYIVSLNSLIAYNTPSIERASAQ